MTSSPRDAWLSLDEAATRWGVTRLRLREAIAAGALPAARDNSGFYRVSADAEIDFAALRAPADKLIEILFDEIEELTSALGERGQEIERYAALAARQQALLARALALAEAAPSLTETQSLTDLNERSQAFAERALASLEDRSRALGQMNGLMERALDTVAGLDAEVAHQQETSERQRALLDRVFNVARASLDKLAGDAPRGGWLGRWRGRMRKR